MVPTSDIDWVDDIKVPAKIPRDLKTKYFWAVKAQDGKVHVQFNEDGSENKYPIQAENDKKITHAAWISLDGNMRKVFAAAHGQHLGVRRRGVINFAGGELPKLCVVMVMGERPINYFLFPDGHIEESQDFNSVFPTKENMK